VAEESYYRPPSLAPSPTPTPRTPRTSKVILFTFCLFLVLFWALVAFFIRFALLLSLKISPELPKGILRGRARAAFLINKYYYGRFPSKINQETPINKCPPVSRNCPHISGNCLEIVRNGPKTCHWPSAIGQWPMAIVHCQLAHGY